MEQKDITDIKYINILFIKQNNPTEQKIAATTFKTLKVQSLKTLHKYTVRQIQHCKTTMLIERAPNEK